MERRASNPAAALAIDPEAPGLTPTQRADALEEKQMQELDVQIAKSNLYTMGEIDHTKARPSTAPASSQPRRMLMGDDPRLPKMPAKPQLLDFFNLFFNLRFAPANHLLQSATHALNAGCDEKIILACLLHDMAVSGFIRADHGYWGAQLVEPYVDEEVSWAIRAHQALRFFPDEAAGYAYPDNYRRWFGDDYVPEPYIVEAYERIKVHKWYMTARLITVNDIYSFDPAAQVSFEPFLDIIGRNFKQPEEGLGFDNSPVAHMWRTMIWPTKFL